MSDSPIQGSGEFAGRYRFERELGRGATATVFLAHDRETGQQLAVKVLRPELVDSIGAKHFLKEIRLTASLHHPRIAPLLDSGEQDGALYFVLPYMEGGTLRQRMKAEGQLPVGDAVSIARSVAATLHDAHVQGLVHRDVKPENILFSGGEPYLADFGIARVLEKAAGDTSTSAGIVRGTVAYMSPEQASGGREIDGRSDVFSLGCVLYEMIAGVPAFIGPTPEVILAQRFTHEPRDLAVYRPALPDALKQVVAKATARAPSDRFRTAAEMAEALTQATIATAPDRAETRRTTRRVPRWAIAAAVVGAATVLWLVFHPHALLSERDWVLVADFEGPVGEPSLANTVRELVTSELNQSKFVGTISRQQLSSVMRLAQMPETTHVNATVARQLAVRTSVRAIIAGNVQRLGPDEYSVAVHVVNASTGRDLTSVATSTSEKDFVGDIGALARDLRSRLGERSESIAATLPLLEAATPSFSAYQKYLEGILALQGGDAARSNALLHDALRIDTAFASAYAALGANFLGSRVTDSAQFYFDRALALPGRLTAAQKYRLQGDVAYSVHHDIDAAAKFYDLYVSELPRTIGGRNNRALYLGAAGKYDESIRDLRDAIASNPLGPDIVQINLFNLSAMLSSVGKADEAATVIRDLKPPFLPAAKLLIDAARSDWRAVGDQSHEIASLGNAPGLIALLGGTGAAAALASQGAVVGAERSLERSRNAASGSASHFYDRCAMLLAAASGRRPLPTAPSTARDPSVGAALVRALAAAMRGDTMTARRELTTAEADTAVARAQLGSGPALVRGWIAAAGGQWQRASAALAATSASGEHDATLLDRISSLEVRWLVARAFEASGKYDSAYVHMSYAVAPLRVPAGHLPMGGLVLPFAHERLATLSEKRGDRLAARTHWQQVVRLLTSPEAEGQELLQRARIALSRLQ